MRGDRSAFETLGLAPDADRAAIDQAYRRLIKQFHPDRPGGDRGRAEEIIRAYRQLRGSSAAPDQLEFNERPADRGFSVVWQIAGLLVAIGLLLLALLAGPFDSGFQTRLRAIELPGKAAESRRAARADPFAAPIDDEDLARTAEQVRRDFGRTDEATLADTSRDCHRRFRQSPDARHFDRCVAFDLAVILLQDRDPMRDQGPFREIAVVRRHWAEAALLSNDYYRIDTRLDRLKLKVELLLAPTVPPPEVDPAAIAAEDQRAAGLPSGASVDEVPSLESDQRNVSEVSNLSE